MGKRSKSFSAPIGKSAPPAVGAIRVTDEKKADASMDTSDEVPTIVLSHSLRARALAQRKTIDKTQNRVKGTEIELSEEDAAAAAAAKGSTLEPVRSVPKSGRVWKQTQTKPSSAMNSKSPALRSWKKKMQRKEEEKAIKERERALKAAQEEARKEEIRRRKQRKQMKEENIKRSLVVQPITNTAKLKHLSKKQLKNIITM